MRYFPLNLDCAAILAAHIEQVRGLPPWRDIFKLLSQGRRFQSIEDLILSSGGDPSQADLVIAEEEFDKLCETGTLVSDSQILQTLSNTPNDEAKAKIGFLGIVCQTLDSNFVRCIDSYFLNAREFGHEIEIVVAADNCDPRTELQSLKILGAWACKKDIRIFYAGSYERKIFARLLADIGIPYSVAQFALSGPEVPAVPKLGASRNSLLLHGVGEMLSMVEADTLCLPLARNDIETRRLALAESPTIRSWVFATKQQALRSCVELKEDFFGAHNAILGREFPAIINQYSPEPETLFGSLCNHIINSILAGRAKIVASTTGIVGPANSFTLFDLLQTEDADTWDRITGSASRYLQAKRAPEILRTTQSLVISHRANSTPKVLSLDSRELSLPFVPAGLNEVSTFEWITTNFFNDFYFAHIPWLIPHDDPNGKALPVDNGKESGYPHFSHLLRACLASRESGESPRPQPADLIVKALGRFLIELSLLEPSDFGHHLKSLMIKRLDAEICDLNQVLLVHDKRPALWQSDICHRLATRKTAKFTDFLRPTDMWSEGAPQSSFPTTQFLIGQYGRLLLWWPEIIVAAKELRHRGRRLGRPVS